MWEIFQEQPLKNKKAKTEFGHTNQRTLLGNPGGMTLAHIASQLLGTGAGIPICFKHDLNLGVGQSFVKSSAAMI
jgi:hypothetical protein